MPMITRFPHPHKKDDWLKVGSYYTGEGVSVTVKSMSPTGLINADICYSEQTEEKQNGEYTFDNKEELEKFAVEHKLTLFKETTHMPERTDMPEVVRINALMEQDLLEDTSGFRSASSIGSISPGQDCSFLDDNGFEQYGMVAMVLPEEKEIVVSNAAGFLDMPMKWFAGGYHIPQTELSKRQFKVRGK